MPDVEVNEGGDLLRARLGPYDRAVIRMHRRGHHVQEAHGRRRHLAAAPGHRSGGMIALLPTAADAKRLALPGGEPAAELHCTLWFLGDDGAAWTADQRNELEDIVRSLAGLYGLEPVRAKVFGVSHWNGDGKKPAWVWNVGDTGDEDAVPLGLVHAAVTEALESTHDRPELPPQHQPWAAHVCAAYTGDLTLVRALEKRLGPVTFDRIRLSFGDEDRDIPLGPEALTASPCTCRAPAGGDETDEGCGHHLANELLAAGVPLRREPTDTEQAAGTDFAEHNRQWESAVALSNSRMISVYAAWRTWIRVQVQAGADTPEEWAELSLGPEQGVDQAAEILTETMLDLARRAGQALQREAERQGVQVPDWSLPDDVTTAAVGGRRLLGSVAQMTANIMASSVVQTARRTVTGLFARDAPAEQIATEVDQALADAMDSVLKGPVGTAMSAAQTAGRQAVLEVAPPGAYYASEILDRNTCGPCKAVDGEQFSDLEIAVKAYPVMGYKDCVGPRYGNACRGFIVARWAPEEVTAGGEVFFHGTKGGPGYELLHGGAKIQPRSLLDEDQEMMLREDLDSAFSSGFTPHSYNAYGDSGSHDYDPDDEDTPDGSVNYVEWEGLARYYASGAGDSWYSDFEGSRRIRRAANELAGLDQTGHDRLLGEGDTDDYDRNAALGLLMGVATAPRLDRELYRGSFYAGADPDEVEAQLRGTDGLDFSVASFTDGRGVADYFGDPALYALNNPGEAPEGTQVTYIVEPGAQGVLGHVFARDMAAGTPGDDEDRDYVDTDEALTDWSREHPREIVTGGHFELGEITREGSRITVRLKQTKTYPPKVTS